MRVIAIIILSVLFQDISSQQVIDRYLEARALMKNGDYGPAIEILDEEISENPYDLDALYQRGMCYYETKMYDKAIPDFLLVNKRAGARSSLMLAKCEARLNHPELSVKYLRQHLGSSFKKPEKELLLDKDLTLIEHTSAWKNLWKEREWYNAYDLLLQEANYLKSNGKYLEALNILNDLHIKGFNRTTVNQKIAEIYLATGNNKAAKEALDVSIRSDYRNTASLKLRIELYTNEGNYLEAEADCSKLLRQAPDEFPHYLIYGKILMHLEKYEEAVTVLSSYIQLFPGNAGGYNEIGKVYMHQKKYINAISSFNKALELDQGVSEYFYNRGLSYAATKMYKFAERDYSMALDLDPENADTWFAKGIADLELNKKDIACFNFKKSFQYGKKEAISYIQRLCN
ncbi:MAG: tetratricopeptide repeat protein [Bacteroidales bacterium]|nr:tetratricopeptide repeat protein [Bacteroidales bacterium]